MSIEFSKFFSLLRRSKGKAVEQKFTSKLIYARLKLFHLLLCICMYLSVQADGWQGKNRWFTLHYYQRHAMRNRDKEKGIRLFRSFFLSEWTNVCVATRFRRENRSRESCEL